VKCGAQLIKCTLLLNVRKNSCVAVVGNVVPKHRAYLSSESGKSIMKHQLTELMPSNGSVSNVELVREGSVCKVQV
jgi:hypothetical protein